MLLAVAKKTGKRLKTEPEESEEEIEDNDGDEISENNKLRKLYGTLLF